ncbi:hypothetical protein BKI52_08180 [marine bacterium AO1-C]|nr:hypothetical protein BKI52_08180 [marine bacterium AO1-C]
MKNYNYFEGSLDYLHYDGETSKKHFKRVYFKEGSFKEEYWASKKSKKPEPSFEIYHHDTQTTYRVDTARKHRNIIYHKPWEDTNTELVSVNKLGEEQILEFDCEIIEVVYKHWLEGDKESFEQTFTYWCCPDIQLREEWHHFSLPFLNHPGICQPYCLALKYTVANEQNQYLDEYTIRKIDDQDIHPKTFDLASYASYKKMSQEEAWQQYEEERESEREKIRQKLRVLVNRSLTEEEQNDPYTPFFRMQVRKALKEYLQRELTNEEHENPHTTGAQLLKSLPSEENVKLGQLILKYTS